MKENILVALAFFFITSCNEHNKTVHPIESLNEPKTNPSIQKEIDTHVGDPNFVVARETISKYGPQSITRNVLQDRNGNIWLATWEGIVCYDGNQFTNFTLKNSLRRFHVFSILEDQTGNLWFGTIDGGVYRFDGKSFTLFSTTEHLAGNKILCMLEDKSGNIWFGTENGVSRYNGYTFTNFTKQDGLCDNFVSTIIQDKSGKFWFGTNGGVSCCYDPSNSLSSNKNIFTNFIIAKDSSFHNVRSIIEDQSRNIWISSQEGLCRFDGKSAKIITTDFIGFIFEDKSGNIWLSNGKAGEPGMSLYSYDGKSFTNMITRNVSKNPLNNQIFGITEDNIGNIWFGTATGVCRYDGKSFTDFSDKAFKL